MPQRKKAKQVRKKTAVKSLRAKAKRRMSFSWTESYSSFLLGVVVVIVTVLFGITVIRQQSQLQQETSSLSTGPTPTISATPTPGTTVTENGNTYYIVKPHDSLWNIAVAVYNNGYKWTEIAKANNLANPGTIFTGDKLLVPNAPSPSEFGQLVGSTNTQTNPDSITGKEYTVKKNDTLWDIAVRAYGDGYKWTDIAKANNLANPDYIFSGNVLTIPR